MNTKRTQGIIPTSTRKKSAIAPHVQLLLHLILVCRGTPIITWTHNLAPYRNYLCPKMVKSAQITSYNKHFPFCSAMLQDSQQLIAACISNMCQLQLELLEPRGFWQISRAAHGTTSVWNPKTWGLDC